MDYQEDVRRMIDVCRNETLDYNADENDSLHCLKRRRKIRFA